jgi:NTP pyrophosphatase (non-canonical NTP hydrolase)
LEDARLLRVLKISEELGEVAEALHAALGANPRKGASHDWGNVAKELADVIVTAMVALDTVSGDGAAVVEHQLQNRVANEPTAAGTSGSSRSSRSTGTWGKSPSPCTGHWARVRTVRQSR